MRYYPVDDPFQKKLAGENSFKRFSLHNQLVREQIRMLNYKYLKQASPEAVVFQPVIPRVLPGMNSCKKLCVDALLTDKAKLLIYMQELTVQEKLSVM